MSGSDVRVEDGLYCIVLSEGRMGCKAVQLPGLRCRRGGCRGVVTLGVGGTGRPLVPGPGDPGSVLNQSVLAQLWRHSDSETALHHTTPPENTESGTVATLNDVQIENCQD